MLIGEVAQHAGLSTRMLRHYDAIGLVSPSARTSGGYRAYSPDDLRRLFQVESLRSLGLPLGDVRSALDDPTFVPSALVDDLIAATQERIAREQELLARLREVRAGEPAAWTDVLGMVALLRGLDHAEPARRQQLLLTAPDVARLPAASLAEALLAEDDPNVAGALQWALGRSDGGGLDVLVAALDAPDREVRRRAVAAVVRIPTDEATAALTGALDHPDEDVRARAALGLGARGGEAAAPELLRMVVRGADDVDAAEVLGALALRHGTADRLARAVEEELRRPGASPAARARLTQALAELDGAAAHEVLTALVDDPDAHVRRIAAYCLQACRARTRRPSAR
ncbi:MerR family transcriptional regulator [Cellulomonas cellasea]|uniref:MerR family transcriptional regulator n=1 Tax=Cellulomonas cellasea TaxID=43670 RepID=A0A4Y3L2C9_9CELL|nr:MerR family transcriptional regulator [Cellulomonas cellasea]